jgi:hypothetical protein
LNKFSPELWRLHVTADPADVPSLSQYHRPSLAEILSDESVKPVRDVHDLAVEGFFESDEELDDIGAPSSTPFDRAST